MIVMPMDRRLAGEFAAALDRRDRQDHAAEPALTPLLTVADTLRPLAGAGPAPTAEFRDQLRTRLLAVASVQPGTVPADGARHTSLSTTTVGWWRRKIVTAGAGVTLAAACIGGVAAISTSALPGDTLYGVKRTVEDVQLSFARGDQSRGSRYLDQARTRLGEVERLVADRGRRPADDRTATRLQSTLGDMASATTQGSTLLTSEYRRTGKDGALGPLRDFTSIQRSRLRDLQPRLPAQLRDQPTALIALLGQIDQQITLLTGPPGTGGGTGATEAPTPGSAPRGTVAPVPGSGRPVPTGRGSAPADGVPAPGEASPATPQAPGHVPGTPDHPETSAPPAGGQLPVPLPVPSGGTSAEATLPPLLPGVEPSVGVRLPPLVLPGVELDLDLGGGEPQVP